MKRNCSWLEAIPYLAALIACAPLIVGGFPQGHDWAFELARVAEFSHALGEGQFPPHWAPNLYGGYGSPVFLFYAPAFVAVATAASAVFGSVAAGASLSVMLFSFIGVFAIRRLFDAIPGVDSLGGRIAATAFALHPYLIGAKLIRNANAEFAPPPRSRGMGAILSGLGAGLWLVLVCVHRRRRAAAREVPV